MFKRLNFLFIMVIIIPITLSAGNGPDSTRNSNWTRFRGPNGQGVGHAPTLSASWTDKDYNWKIKLPGKGHSSPVVWKNIIFVSSSDVESKKGYVLAYDVSNGRQIWKKELDIRPYEINKDNDYAASSPTVDANHVYTIWYSRESTFLVAMNHQGEEIWRTQFNGSYSRHGSASSPVVYGDLVVFTREQEGDSPYKSTWVAVDVNTGNIKWELERNKGYRFSLSSPCLFNSESKNPQLLFTSREHGFTIVDLMTGKVLWEKGPLFNHRVIASPVFSEGMLIGTCKRKLIAIKLDHQNDTFEGKLVYELPTKLTSYVPTPIIKGNLLFVCIDNGNIACINLLNGEVLWREKPAGAFYSSPVLVNDRLYCVTKKGEVVVLNASKDYKLLAINHLDENSFATPAVAGGKMYFRTFSHLFSLGKK